MKGTTRLAIAVGTALALGVAVAEVNAHPGGMGWGTGIGSGFGMHGGMGAGMHAGMGPGMHGGMGPGMHGGAGMYGHPNAGTAEERLAGLKTELGITAEQDGAWQAFAKSVKQQEESRQAWFARMHETPAAGSLPEQRARQDELFKERQAARESATTALKDLYAALTPQQKAIADRNLGGHGPGHFGGHHGQFR